MFILNLRYGHHVIHRALLDRVTPTAIYDRLAMVVDDTTTKRSRETGLSALPIAGFRLRIRGRPRGEEMATRHDFLKGSCPKRDQDALIDFGKYAVQGRSGVVGVKAWVHFQKPHREDLTGERQLLHLLGATVEEDEDDYDEATRLEQPFGQPHAGGDAALLKALGGGGESAGITSASHRSEAERTNNDSNDDEEKRKRYHPLNLFATDRDYDPAEKIPVLNDRGRGLWNVNNSNDPEVNSLVRTLKTLHTPDHAPASRFIW